MRKIQLNPEHAITLVDQALVALISFGSLFAAGLLLPPAEFVAYTLTVAVAALIQSVGTGLIGVPALHYIATSHSNFGRRYLKIIILSVFALGGLIATLVATLAPGYPGEYLLAALVLGIAWCSFETLRRVSFATERGRQAILGTSLALVVAISLFSIAASGKGTPSPQAVILVLAASYCAGGLALFLLCFRGWQGANTFSIKGLCAAHWLFARWQLLGIGLFWIYTQGLLFALAETLNPIDLAIFRLAGNTAAVSSVLAVWMENQFQSRVSGDALLRQGGMPSPGVLSELRLTGLRLAAIYLITWPAVAAGLFALLYGDRYGLKGVSLSFAFCTTQFFLLLARPDIVISRAMGAVWIGTAAHLGTLLLTLGISIPLSVVFGITGAIAGVLIGSVTFFVVFRVFVDGVGERRLNR